MPYESQPHYAPTAITEYPAGVHPVGAFDFGSMSTTTKLLIAAGLGLVAMKFMKKKRSNPSRRRNRRPALKLKHPRRRC